MLSDNDVKQELHRLFLSVPATNLHNVGIEIELSIVSKEEDYSGNHSHDLQNFIINHLNFIQIFPDKLIFRHKTEKDIISFEYSINTLEFSMEKSDSLMKIKKRFLGYYDALQNFMKTKNLMLCGCGLHPHWQKINTRALELPHYQLTEYYLAQGAKESYLHNHDDFCAYSCAVQTHIDINHSIPELLNIYSFLGCIKGFLFSNSVDLTQTCDFQGMACVRDYLWWCSMFAFCSENVGYYHNIKTNDDIIDNMLQRSMYYVCRDNEYLYIGPYKLAEYFSKDSVLAYNIFTGNKTTLSPQITDLQYFRSYKAIELTKRHTIEIRDDCQQPVYDTFGPCAFNLGISEALPEAYSLIDKLCKDMRIDFYNFINNRRLSTSLNPMLSEFVLNKWRIYCREFVLIARKGLQKRNLGEEELLDSVLKRHDILENPAKVAYKKWHCDNVLLGID